MISADDIDALKELDKDIEVATEFVRRYEKGLPEDRLTDSVQGTFRLARANRRIVKALLASVDMMAAMHAEIESHSSGSTEVFKDPCRD